jgi:hypothetical protein
VTHNEEQTRITEYRYSPDLAEEPLTRWPPE